MAGTLTSVQAGRVTLPPKSEEKKAELREKYNFTKY